MNKRNISNYLNANVIDEFIKNMVSRNYDHDVIDKFISEIDTIKLNQNGFIELDAAYELIHLTETIRSATADYRLRGPAENCNLKPENFERFAESLVNLVDEINRTNFLKKEIPGLSEKKMEILKMLK